MWFLYLLRLMPQTWPHKQRGDWSVRIETAYPEAYLPKSLACILLPYVVLFCCHTSGGGGIRTPGAFALRFSRPLPSSTRPLLQGRRMALVTWRQHERKRKFSSCANKFCTATDNAHQSSGLAPAESPSQAAGALDSRGFLLSHRK